MNRMIPYLVIGLTVFIILGIDIGGLTHMVVTLVLLLAALHLMFKQRLPTDFLKNIIFLLLGPSFLVCLIMVIYEFISEKAVSQGWLSLLILILLLFSAWYYWQSRQNRRQRQLDQFQMRGNEREFIIPFNQQRETPDDVNNGEEE
jgi:L-asparagine transporter-like permease